MEPLIHSILNIDKHYINSYYEIEYSPNGTIIYHNKHITITPDGKISYHIYDHNFNIISFIQLQIDLQNTQVNNDIEKTIVFIVINNSVNNTTQFPYDYLILKIFPTYITRILINNNNPVLNSTVYCNLLCFNQNIFNFMKNAQITQTILDNVKSQNIIIFYKDFIEYCNSNIKRYYYCFCISNDQIEYMQNTFGEIGILCSSNYTFMNKFFTQLL